MGDVPITMAFTGMMARIGPIFQPAREWQAIITLPWQFFRMADWQLFQEYGEISIYDGSTWTMDNTVAESDNIYDMTIDKENNIWLGYI